MGIVNDDNEKDIMPDLKNKFEELGCTIYSQIL
jgi:hypothetical protein